MSSNSSDITKTPSTDANNSTNSNSTVIKNKTDDNVIYISNVYLEELDDYEVVDFPDNLNFHTLTRAISNLLENTKIYGNSIK